MKGWGLLMALGVVVVCWGCGSTTSMAPPAPVPAMPTAHQPAQSCAQVPVPRTEPESALDLDRALMTVPPPTYSPALYDGLLSRVAPADYALRQTALATRPSTLYAKEDGLFLTKEVNVDGDIILLGTSGHYTVGFTIARTVDSDHGRPSGTTWATKKLRFRTYDCGTQDGCPRNEFTPVALRGAQAPTIPDPNTVYFKPVDGCTDAILVWLPGTTEWGPTLGFSAPVDHVRKVVKTSTRLFGVDFCMISKAEYSELSSCWSGQNDRGFRPDEVLLSYGLTLLLGELMTPAIGAVTSGIFESQDIATVVRDLTITGIKQQLFRELKTRPRSNPTRQPGQFVPPVSFPLPAMTPLSRRLDVLGTTIDDMAFLDTSRMTPDDRSRAAKYLAYLIQREPVAAVRRDSTSRSLYLFVPSRKLNLNYELIAGGFVALDTASDKLLSFPEFIAAAAGPLMETKGPTKTVDENYKARVKALLNGRFADGGK